MQHNLLFGKSLTSELNYQKVLFEIDRLIVANDGFGTVGNLAYKISWLDQNSLKWGYFRQIFAPRNRLKDLLQNGNDSWEAYIIDTKGILKGSISTTKWDWDKNLAHIWQENAMFQFTKL